ncbi:uncharacterized mitochondrial protein-like protein [Tanacetum coccineum]
MTGNKSYLSDYEEIDGGFVAFGGDPKRGRIIGKGKISTGKLDFKDVYFVKELKFNLFSVTQMCDKINSVLFIDTECVVLSPDFKLLDENQVLLRVPKKDNMHSVDLKNIVPSGGIENLIDLKVKVIRCDNGTKFKNKVMNQFCEMNGRKLALSFMRPFGCLVIILNTLDHLGKFDVKDDEGFFVGYSTNSKAFRVFNNRTRIVEENLHVKFSEETLNIAGNIPNWLFDIDALTISMNYKPVVAENQTNGNACTKENINVGQAGKKIVHGQEYILLPLLTSDPLLSKSSNDSPDVGFKPSGEEEKIDFEHLENEDSEVPNTEEPRVNQEQDANVNNTNNINTVSPTVKAADIENNAIDENIVYGCIDDPNMPNLEDIIYSDDDEEVSAEAVTKNLATTVPVSLIPTTRVHKDHLLEQIIGDIHSAPQTKRMIKNVTEHVEPKKKFWTLVNLPYGKRAIGTRWVYINKKDDRGFEDLEFPNKVYKVEKALYGLHQAPRAWYETLSTYLLENGFRRGTMDKTLFINKDKDGAQEIPDEFYGGAHFLLRVAASTPMETNKALLKDEEAADVDVHLYRSMIGSLMYLTASRPDIMFVVCACARFQVTPKTSHLHAVKRIFRYLKDKTVIKEWEDRMERAATTASSLEAELDSSNINRTQSMATLNESFP